jgi:hypothetical protein
MSKIGVGKKIGRGNDWICSCDEQIEVKVDQSEV